MPDYKEMYLKLFRATEAAVSCLIAAQLECEELYIRSSETAVQPSVGLKEENGFVSSEKNPTCIR